MFFEGILGGMQYYISWVLSLPYYIVANKSLKESLPKKNNTPGGGHDWEGGTGPRTTCF